GDNELTALKSSGVSLYQMLPSAVVLTVLAAAFTAGMTMWGQPLGWHAFENLSAKIVQAKPRVTIKEKVLIDSFSRMIMHVDREKLRGALQHVFIRDERDPQAKKSIMAKTGRLVSNPDGRSLTLILYDGIIQTVSPDMSKVNTVHFKTFNMVLDMGHILAGNRYGPKHPKEMVIGELFRELGRPNPDKRRRHVEIEFNQRFSIPLACLIMGLLGLPLGMQTRSQGKLSGVVMALMIFVIYYLFMSSAFAFGKSGALPPAIGVWLPNVVFGLLTIYMIREAANDKTIVFVRIFSSIVFNVRRLFAGRKHDEAEAGG
ncbi:MAG: LptF/LptG family permease, partial [Proteobacteria bacterium]|nr:LptF/LptG family permease [Pseudomonadota bacterium]